MMNLAEKYRGTTVDGIFFTESLIKEPHTILGKLDSKSLRMNANLRIIKEKLAAKAKQIGADAIMKFEYGQKRDLISLWDDTRWYGRGIAIQLQD